MQNVNQMYTFSTEVTENSEENEFEIEFSPCPGCIENEDLSSKITKNFDELIDFIDQLQDDI